MNTLISILIFLIMFTIIVFSHEFGHFLIAKLNGIAVREFFIGMGPSIIHFTKGGTKYSLKLLPLGGACVFEGDDEFVKNDNEKENNQEENAGEKEGGFMQAGVFRRIQTVLAGPVFNFIFAFIFSLIILGFCGSDKPVIQNIMEGYPAKEAGLMKGDTILKVNNEKIHLYRQVSLISALNRGETLTITYERNNEVYETKVIPEYDEEGERYYIGIQGAGEVIECKGADLFRYGWYEVEYWFSYTFKCLKMLFTGQLKADNLAGPVGMTQQIGETYEAVKPYGFSSVLFTMMEYAVLVSVNLGVLNLLPIPALDGGRLLFMLIEVVRGKPIPPDKEGIVHLVGFALLFLLMVFVMYNDIMRLF